MQIESGKFLAAFFGNDEKINFRVFSDRKAEEPHYKGNKYAETLKDFGRVLLPVLEQHNAKNRGIFFVVNGGGQYDDDIIKINAQFCESDSLGLTEQMRKIEAFILPPSIIVKTRKSLHTYWLVDQAKVTDFRAVQLRLAAQFDGDTQCQNESRVMRLPGFFHCKQEPVMVECLKFEPGLRYTQAQLAEHLPEIVLPPFVNVEQRADMGAVSGDARQILEKCAFVRHCRDNPQNLPEPWWHAMVTNVSLAKDGPALVHEMSKPYKGYKAAETDAKIKRAIEENKPHTCAYIRHRLCFNGCGECDVKAPVVHCVLSMAEQVKQYLETEIADIGSVFEPRALQLMAYAKLHMPAEYARFKLRLKNKVSLRDYDNAIRHQILNDTAFGAQAGAAPLELQGLDLPGVVQPQNWDVSIASGVRKIVSAKDGTHIVCACPSAVVISKRHENIDTDSEKVEISFFRNGRWKRVVAARSAVFNKSSLIAFGDSGLPVSSTTAMDLVNYLSDFEQANIDAIPFVKSISRIGWINTGEFYPYVTKGAVVFETEFKEAADIIKSLKSSGNFETWKDTVSIARQNEIARFLIAACFASPLLELLKHRVFFVHVWHDSKSGKTAAIKVGVSVWGNPAKLMGSFNATAVGLERMAGTLKHLPFAIDELQVLQERRLSVETIVYSLGNGFGRLRGTKDGGVQDLATWRNIIITSGEQPLSKENSNDGVFTRVLELYGKPVEEQEFAHDLHLLSEQNFGFAGEVFVQNLTAQMAAEPEKLQADFVRFQTELKARHGALNHIDNVAVVCLGDYYAEQWVFGGGERGAYEKAVSMGAVILENNKQLETGDTITRAWDFVAGWLISNKGRFDNSLTPCFGAMDGGAYLIIPSYLRAALEEQGFDYTKVTRGFKERGLFESFTDGQGNSRMQSLKKINGAVCRVFTVRLERPADEPQPLTGNPGNL